jgi:hypothetical protein
MCIARTIAALEVDRLRLIATIIPRRRCLWWLLDSDDPQMRYYATESVEDRSGLDLSLARLVFFAGNSPTFVIVLESIHLTLGLNFISGARGQCARCSTA